MARQPTNAELYEAIQSVLEATSLFSNSTDARFAQIDKRFEQIDKRFDRIEVRLTNVEDRVSDLTLEMRAGFERLDRRLLAVEHR